MSNRTVNLKDVAAKAGVSITTVSHVINKTRFVKPETTAAVESAIKELNYVHNLAAKTLRSKKSGIIGVMITGFGNPYFLEILQGIEHILSEKGYQMILGNIGSSMGAQEKQMDIFNSWCVDGMITYGQGYQNLSQKYDSLNCPVVCIESPGGDQTDRLGRRRYGKGLHEGLRRDGDLRVFPGKLYGNGVGFRPGYLQRSSEGVGAGSGA